MANEPRQDSYNSYETTMVVTTAAWETLVRAAQKNQADHVTMGNEIIKKWNICRVDELLLIYDKESGLYRQGDTPILEAIVKDYPTLKKSQRAEILDYIKLTDNRPTREPPPPNLIPLKSKVLDIESGEQMDYSPDLVFFSKFPWDYNPLAPAAERIDKVLSDIANGDDELVAFILQVFGYCLYPVNQYRAALILYGGGSNGKSTLLNLLRRMLGDENVSNLSLQDLTDRFRASAIFGKAANIGDDIPATYIKDSSIFKKCVTGEAITVERKHEDPFSFTPHAKLFFAANALPPVSDTSRAFISRVHVVPLNADFSKDPKPELKDCKWTDKEMAYLIRLAVEGLKRLLEEGHFTIPECVADATADYALDNSTLDQFIADYCEKLHEKPRTKWAYDCYRAWMQEHGYKGTLGDRQFTRQICLKLGLKSEARYVPTKDGKGMESAKCLVPNL